MSKTMDASDFSDAPDVGIPSGSSSEEPKDTGATARDTSSDATAGEEPQIGMFATPEGERSEGPEDVAAEQKPPSQAKEFRPQHKTWEETEKARLQAVREMTRAKQEAARYRRILETMKQTGPDAQTQVRSIAKWAVQEINKIPDDDPEKEIKAGEIWLQAQMRAHQIMTAQERQRELSNRELLDYTVKLATDLGMKTEADMEAFWVVAPLAPKDLPLEEAIQWTVDQVKMFKERVLKDSQEAQKAEAEKKKNLQVMGRGASGFTSANQEETGRAQTLGDAIMASRKQKIVKGVDFR